MKHGLGCSLLHVVLLLAFVNYVCVSIRLPHKRSTMLRLLT